MPGNVSIDSDTGDESKSGAAEALYDAMKAHAPSAATGTDLATMIAVRQALGDLATDIGATLVQYLIANTEVVIGAGDSGLQRTPDPNDANTDTQGPSAEKTLSIQ